MGLKRKISFFFCSFLILMAPHTDAEANTDVFRSNKALSLVGIIESKARNSLLIFDEREKTSHRFVFLREDEERWQKGDRVRVFYRPNDMLITNIKKMRPVERKEGQNAGVIFTADDK